MSVNDFLRGNLIVVGAVGISFGLFEVRLRSVNCLFNQHSCTFTQSLSVIHKHTQIIGIAMGIGLCVCACCRSKDEDDYDFTKAV